MGLAGLVRQDDPPGTKAGKQVVRHAAPSVDLANQGIGAVVPRHDPYAQREIAFPDVATGRPELEAALNPLARTLDKVVSSDFANVGKPDIYAKSRSQVWLSTNIPSILSFDGWPPEDGYYAKWIRTNRISVPRGFQTAMVDPVLINAPDSSAYGTQQTVPGASIISLQDLYV